MKYGTFYSRSLEKTVKQINKLTAERLYNSGDTICIQACNMPFGNMWQSADLVNKENGEGTPFDVLVKSYTYYNCDKERGKYPCFFVIVK